MNLVISIRFRIRGCQDEQIKSFSPDDFFDLEPGEHPDIESVHKYAHACEYLEFKPNLLEFTELLIESRSLQKRIIIRETFWKKNNRLIERRDYIAKIIEYEECIIEIFDCANSGIIKFRHGEHSTEIAYHVNITHKGDGSVIERRIHP